jgi:hypothetical protein
MRTQNLVIALVAAALLAGIGCESTRLKSITQSIVPGETAVYPQDQEVTLVKPFGVKIGRCFWADELGKAGYENVPAPLRDQFLAKPNGKFLVIEITITNLGTQPAAWKSDVAPVFRLKNAKGFEYAPVHQDINGEDITAKIVLGQVGTINPQMVIRGREVFDVSKDDYQLVVSTGKTAGAMKYITGPTLWAWALSPAAN